MGLSAASFENDVSRALADQQLQRALTGATPGLITKRATARAALPEFDKLRREARDIKDHVLAHLDLYLEAYETKVRESGGEVHWAASATEACDHIVAICRRHRARTVTKGKSMVAEEIDLNAALEDSGIVPVETDLGEYVMQLRKEPPSHFILPAVHLTRDQIEADFRNAHAHLPRERNLNEIPALVAEARQVLRQKYFEADAGITGANFLVAETGTSIIVTNEGNGDLAQTLPKVHIVIASVEKIVPTLEDASTILRVLARSALGQELSSYTTFSTGPRRMVDPDGPQEYHVVLVDNGRSEVLGTAHQDMLRCIRCGACLNHCPVYQAIGGQAYGWVHVGPIGAVVGPALKGVESAGHLANASTFCGRCEEVCPMQIPLPKLMRHWREKEFERHLIPVSVRSAIRVWAFLAKHPRLYQSGARAVARLLCRMGRVRGRISALPLAGGWTRFRDFPAAQGKSFQEMWRAQKSQASRRSGA